MDIDTNGRGIAQIDNSEPPTCECCGDVYTMETGDEPTPFCDRCAHDVLEKQTAELTEARATIATLTHRAEVAEAECERERESAALWRERCNKAEARVAAYQREIHRIACGEQVEGDGLCPDGIALAAAQDAYEAAGYEAFQCANERDAARFLAAGWRRLARHYQSCHLAGHACLRETHRAKGEQVAALRRARDDDAAHRSDLMEQCDKLRDQAREAALARDAAIANAEAVLSTAEALRVERDRMRDYWRSEAEMRGACLVEIDQLRTKLARAEGVVGHMRDIAEHECAYRDGCPTFGSRHGQCTGCKAREALATYEEG